MSHLISSSFSGSVRFVKDWCQWLAPHTTEEKVALAISAILAFGYDRETGVGLYTTYKSVFSKESVSVSTFQSLTFPGRADGDATVSKAARVRAKSPRLSNSLVSQSASQIKPSRVIAKLDTFDPELSDRALQEPSRLVLDSRASERFAQDLPQTIKPKEAALLVDSPIGNSAQANAAQASRNIDKQDKAAPSIDEDCVVVEETDIPDDSAEIGILKEAVKNGLTLLGQRAGKIPPADVLNKVQELRKNPVRNAFQLAWYVKKYKLLQIKDLAEDIVNRLIEKIQMKKGSKIKTECDLWRFMKEWVDEVNFAIADTSYWKPQEVTKLLIMEGLID